ncbi:hypothetical protein HK097_007744 [Rhizophlyctis rosea]|uniref:Short-chain dehydrogenase n=1 Tax=Rhizophlyctis rosea TaxID=64517 RepID=A0AAD5X5R2_9FUNG|nr:hypothetical protein HK097_007744 [Rhizophlyctis rosea]
MALRTSLAIVVGVGPGTGAAVARKFAKEGLKVALLARNAGYLDTLKKEIEAEGGKAEAFPCDVTSAENVAQTFDSIKASTADSNWDVFVYSKQHPE